MISFILLKITLQMALSSVELKPVAIFMVLGCIIRTLGSPYGEFRTVTLHIVQCPTNHPSRCDLTGQDLTQDQFPRFTSTETYYFVYLDDNHFRYVPRGTFDHQPELRYLTLERNQLTVIDQYMLSRLQKLHHFNAAHNFILTVHPNGFKGTLNMKTLTLNDKEILYFPPEILCYLKHLDELYLHNNNMTTFQIQPYCEPENSVHLSLSDNPFCCDARMAWVKRLERLGKLFWHTGPDGIHLTPSCVNLPDIHWFDISREDLMTATCPVMPEMEPRKPLEPRSTTKDRVILVVSPTNRPATTGTSDSVLISVSVAVAFIAVFALIIVSLIYVSKRGCIEK